MGNDASRDTKPVPTISIPEEIQQEYAFSLNLDSKDKWNELAYIGKDRLYSRTTLVKAVVQHFLDPKNPSKNPPRYQPILYFLNSQAYLTHLPFCANACHFLSKHVLTTETEYIDTHKFNLHNYKFYPRQFILLTIVHYQDLDCYAVELWPGDNLPAAAIKQTHEMLKSNTFFGDKLKWRAASPLHQQIFKDVDIPEFYDKIVISNSQLFDGISFQPLFMGEAFGILKIWKNGSYDHSKDDNSKDDMKTDDMEIDDMNIDDTGAPVVDRRTILVCEELPNDLNPIRALVTQQLQTPLCHVALLCTNRKTPNMAYKSAIQDFQQYEGQLVRLMIMEADFKIELATEEQEQLWIQRVENSRNARPLPELKLNTEVNQIIDLVDIDPQEGPVQVGQQTTNPDMQSHDLNNHLDTSIIDSIGSKALNLAKFLKWKIEPTRNCANKLSFVIPFHFFKAYTDFVAFGEISSLSRPDIPEHEAKVLCKTIRQKITSGNIPKELHLESMIGTKLAEWTTKLRQNNSLWADGVIFRSSTNCEDFPGFPSAGLYESEPVEVVDWKEIEAAILRVWASTYLEKAYLERREFQIPESKVSMAILVMPYLKSCIKANGVAVTTNPFRPDLGGNFLNVQAGTDAVTDSCGGATPEQVVFIRDGFDDLTIEYCSSSSLMPTGAHIITPQIAKPLHNVLSAIGDRFRRYRDPKSDYNAADVEFFLLSDDSIVIVQVRPINVQHRHR